MDYNRAISQAFLTDLQTGMLRPLLVRVKEDDTLMLALRGSYINIYYRGGSLFKIELLESSSAATSSYRVEFDTDYNKNYPPLPVDFPFPVTDAAHVSTLTGAIPELKCVMDRYFARKGKPEREFQQLVVRENNRSMISNETDYFIIDIEIAGILPNAKYDMLAVRWLGRERGKAGTLVPALIEMKYGINALDGASGMAKHLEDAYSLKAKDASWCRLVHELEVQFNNSTSLGC